MRLYLIRHSLTAGNLERRYIGRTDEGLCKEGMELLRSRTYPEAEAVFVSPMKRCVQTAELIYPEQTYVVVEELAECDFGKFENRNYEELSGMPEYQAWIDSGVSGRGKPGGIFRTVPWGIFQSYGNVPPGEDRMCRPDRTWRDDYEYYGAICEAFGRIL